MVVFGHLFQKDCEVLRCYLFLEMRIAMNDMDSFSLVIVVEWS